MQACAKVKEDVPNPNIQCSFHCVFVCCVCVGGL